jgi:hypothetical protein
MDQLKDGAHRWLILAHQLPAHPSNLRVRVWRRLQQIGAVVLRSSLYVLPSTEETREDFNWVREEIIASGGQASILEASVVDGQTDGELIQHFRDARNEDYHAFTAEARAAQKHVRHASGRRRRGTPDRELRRFRERLAAIRALDFFGASGRPDAEQALAEMEASGDGSSRAAAAPTLNPRDFRGRIWVTRPRPGIDRMASAWLIRRFIARDARFAFVAPGTSIRAAQIPFDMADVEFGHHGLQCTFETLMRRFGIIEPAAVAVSRVVHDLDLKESRYAMPECAAVGRLVDGLRAAHADDSELLEQGIVMIDALYRSFTSDRPPRKRRPKSA